MGQLRLAGALVEAVQGLVNGWLRRIEANDGDPALRIVQSGSGDGLRIEMGADTFWVGPGAVPLVPRLEVDDAATYLDKDASNNLVLADAVTGVKTLAELAAGGGGGHQAQRVVVDDVGTYQTTSTTFVDIDATRLSITMTTGASWVLIFLSGTTWNTSSPGNMFDVTVDGVRQGGANGIHYEVGNVPHGVSLTWLTQVAAGSHEFRPQWRVSAGTGMLAASSAMSPVMFAVIEIL
jgi:hypothetical protein